MVRNYKNMDVEHYRSILFNSFQLAEATYTRDIEDIVNLITDSIVSALDQTAPSRRIQLSKKNIDFRSEETKNKTLERNQLQIIADSTNQPEDWRYFRMVRNLVRNMVKKDKIIFNKKLFSSNNPSAVWKAAQRMAGKVA